MTWQHIAAWEPDNPTVVLSSGPSHARAATEDDGPYKPTQPVGFVRQPRRPASPAEPLLWEGDNT